MRYLVLALSAVLLSGCLTPGTMLKGVSAVNGAGLEKAADGLLKRNVEQTCNWPTIGSLEREYGNNPTKYREYHAFCDHRTDR